MGNYEPDLLLRDRDEELIQPCPSPEVEVCLRVNSRFRAGLGLNLVQVQKVEVCLRVNSRLRAGLGFKPCPSPEVEFCLRVNSRLRAGLGFKIQFL